MDVVTVVKLSPEDAEAFQELRMRALEESPAAFGASVEEVEALSPDEVAGSLVPSECSTVFGARTEHGSLIGIAGLKRERGVKTSHKAFLWGMYVLPELRNRGVGRLLLDAVMSEARCWSGLHQVNLTVVTTSWAARSLYQSAGFVKFGVERSGYLVNGETFDLEYMVFDLRMEQQGDD